MLIIVGAALWWIEAIGTFRADRPWWQEAGGLLIAGGMVAVLLSLVRPRRLDDEDDADARLRALRREEAGRRTLRRNLVVLSVLLILVGLLFFVRGGQLGTDAALGYFLLAFMPIGVWLFFGSEHLAREISAIHDQLFEQTGSVTPRELRAERLFLLHRAELDRYYAQARSQSYWIFVGGLAALVFGAIIVLATLQLVSQALADPAPDSAEPLVIALLGGTTGVLTEFVAALIFRMYDGVARALNQFHGRLVETNHLYFGNLLLAKIDDDERRWVALTELAADLAKVEIEMARDTPSPSPNGG